MVKNSDARFGVRVSEELGYKFKVACALKKVTAQKVLEDAIREFVEKNNPE